MTASHTVRLNKHSTRTSQCGRYSSGFAIFTLTYPLTVCSRRHSGALSRVSLAASYASYNKAINGLEGSQTSSVSDHYRAGVDGAGNETNSKVPSMGRQKAAIKARREAKRVLRRDSRSHRQREEESDRSLITMLKNRRQKIFVATAGCYISVI